VYLNLAPGLVSVTDVLRALIDAIPIEAAHVMAPEDGKDPAIFAEFRKLVAGIDLQRLGRFPFYDAARGPDLALAIATGEQRLYANLLLTIGVVTPD
jgi:L-fucose mutarotase